MFSSLKRMIGNVTVEVKDSIVYVEGVPADVISNDIKRIWGTGRINQHMFVTLEPNAFSFYEFFTLDVVYAIETLLDNPHARTSRRTLGRIRDELLEHTWLARRSAPFSSKLNYSVLSKFTLTPLDFQQKFFEAYDNITQQNGLLGYLLAGAAGSGKTLSAIVLMEMLEKDTVIVVCPNNALERVWETNLLDKYHNPPSYWIAKSGKPFTGKEKFIVVNYEYLAQLIKDIPKLRLGKIGIVLDESHNFNEVKSLRTELFLELCTITKCEDILWLSGTPIKALGSEAIPLIRCIDPLFTKECEERFKKIFGTSSERATDILNHRLNQLMFKVEKKELKILPPIFKEIKVRVPGSEKYTLDSVRAQMQAFTEERLAYYAQRMESDQKTFYACLDEHERTLSTQQERNTYKHYRTCLSATIASGGDARVAKDEIVYCNKYESRTLVPSLSESSKKRFREVKSIVKYVKLKVQGECLGRIVGRARINAHIDMAPYIDYRSVTETTEKKTVVFTSFTEVINVLEKKLPELGFDPLFVYGKTNSQLSAIIRKFDSDKDVNPLVATYASLSTAVPLLSADVMIMIDAPWRDYVLQQTVSRISRLGADTQTYVYTAVLDTGDKPNISTRSFDILKWSQQMVSAITGVTSPFEISDDIEQADMALESFFESEAQTVVPNYLSW